MTTTADAASYLKVPLIVGITGHIDIVDSEEFICEQLAIFWSQLRLLVGPETPIILLSSIACGADHYAVKYCPSDVKYCVVLPFAAEKYKCDFKTCEDLQNFETDLAGAEKVIECHAAPGDYSVAADYIRTHSDVILSMWDGYKSLTEEGLPKPGGTYYQICMMFQLNDLLIPPQEKKHLVVNLRVHRKNKHAINEHETFQDVGKLDVLSWSESISLFTGIPFEQYRLEDNNEMSVLETVRRINQNALAEEIKKDSWLEQQLLQATGEEEARNQQKKLDSVMQDFMRYSYFDSKAIKHRNSFWKEFNRILAISFIAAICSQLAGDMTFSSDDVKNDMVVHVLMVLFLGGMFFSFAYQKLFVEKKDNYSKYCNCRVIAELLRLKIFWTLAGIKDDFSKLVLEESGNYSCALPICNWEISDKKADEQAIELECRQGMPTVRRVWLEGQLDYYRNITIPRYFKMHKKFSLLANFCYWLSIFTSCLFLIHYYFFSSVDLLAWCGLDHTHYKEILISFGIFIFTALGWLLEKKQWKKMAETYSYTADLFERTVQKFEKIDNLILSGEIRFEQGNAEKQHLVKELAEFCHEENLEWKNIKSNSYPRPMI